MDFRIARAASGMAWFRGGIRMLDRNPRSLFAISLVYVLIGLLPQLLQSVPDLAIVTMVLNWLLFPALWAGMLHAVGEADAGRPVAVTHLFEGLRRRGARGPLLLFGVLVLLAFMVCGYAALHFLGDGDPAVLLQLMSRLAKQQIDPASAEGLRLAVPLFKTFGVTLLVAAVVLSGLFFAVPRVFFVRRGGADALAESLVATSANVLPLTVLGLVGGGVLIVLLLVLAIGLALFTLFGSIGTTLFMPIVIAVYAIVCLVGASVNYLAWREVFGRNDADDASAPGGIVV